MLLTMFQKPWRYQQQILEAKNVPLGEEATLKLP
jgi:hypothetical protein